MAKGFIDALQHMNGTDEWYTPQHAVEVILPYVPKEYTIWCPFDKKISQYVQVFKRGGITLNTVILTMAKTSFCMNQSITIVLSVIHHIARKMRCMKDCLNLESRLPCLLA